MTTILLPPDLEAAVAAQATIENLSVEQLVLQTLTKYFIRPPAYHSPVVGPTMYDFLKEYVGKVESLPESEPAKGNDEFLEYLLDKQRRGHL